MPITDFSMSVAVGQAWTQAPQDTHSDSGMAPFAPPKPGSPQAAAAHENLLYVYET
jgi:hypothetical protein